MQERIENKIWKNVQKTKQVNTFNSLTKNLKEIDKINNCDKYEYQYKNHHIF